MEAAEIIRQLGKMIDDKKQEKAERKEGRLAQSTSTAMDIAYIDGQIDGLRAAISLLRHMELT